MRRFGLQRRPSPDVEDGYSLIEMMVAMSLMMLMILTIYGILDLSGSTAKITSNRVQSLDDTSVALDRIVRSIRQATSITSVTSSSLTFKQYETNSGGTVALHTIVISCTGTTSYTCTRGDTDPGPPSTTITLQVVKGLTSPNIFSQPDAVVSPANVASIQVKLSQTISGESNPVVLQQTVSPRNCLQGGC